MDPWSEVRKQAIQVIKEATGLDASETLEEPKPEFGELSTTIAFDIAEEKSENPAKIAGEIAGKIDIRNTMFKKVETKGPYINFRIKWPEFAKFTLAEITRKGKEYGKTNYFAGQVLLEFPAVNPNKPWHIGHCRNAVLGDATANLLQNVGFQTTKMDYINDLGLQIAKTYWKIQNKKPQGKYDQWLGEMYVQAEKELQENPELMEEVRNTLIQMENQRTARQMCENCVKAQYKTAFRLGIYHDLLVWETDMTSSGLFQKALEKMKECPHIKKTEQGKNAGCVIADLSEFKEMRGLQETEKVLVRSDGTPTYTGKDVAFHMWKVGLLPDYFKYKTFIKQPNEKTAWSTDKEGQLSMFKPAQVLVNVIGAEQAQPQRLVYLTLRALGYENWDKMFHLSYQHVKLPQGRMSGRKGLFITTDQVLDEAVERAEKIIQEKNPQLKNKEEVAEEVGVGAVRFTMLKTAPEKEITFNWEQALSFEGDSGPYCQYSHARACRILEKAETPQEVKLDKLNDTEKKLILLMSKYPYLLKKIVLGMEQKVWGTSLSINQIPEYACQLASVFNHFYGENPVLKAETLELRKTRLKIVNAFKQVMNNALNIIGIKAVKEM